MFFFSEIRRKLASLATPDISQYQYDEQSTYYYDPLTGLYYDAHSQYYYNGDTGEYMYWNAEQRTYTVAPDATTCTVEPLSSGSKSAEQLKANSSSQQQQQLQPADQQQANDESNNAGNAESSGSVVGGGASMKPKVPGDKVKVAKKIVKDMERWAKQLNQKKDQMYQLPAAVAPTANVSSAASVSATVHSDVLRPSQSLSASGGYADVGFSILENRDRSSASVHSLVHHHGTGSSGSGSMVKTLPSIASSSAYVDSDSETETQPDDGSNSEYVAYDKLTCLLCKRAFGSADVLTKHVQMSQLHKDNLRKLQQHNGTSLSSVAAAADDPTSQLYRDRAKERRLKYGEPEPPPVPVRTKQQQQQQQLQQIAQQQQQQATSKKMAAQPIGQNNVGNRLLQKMGWQEGQGLGRANQGRTNIIEAESRAPAAGLGTKSTAFVPGDDYKTYIKRMMKARYEQAED